MSETFRTGSGRWGALLSGAGLFLAVQGVLFLTTVPIAAIEDSGWFLNSGRGLLAVVLSCAIAGALIGLARRHTTRDAAMAATGAVLAMIAVLFSIGPGTIFPIVIVIGTVMIAGPMLTGALVGAGVRRAFRPGKA